MERQNDGHESPVPDMGEYPVVGPVPISIAAQAEPPHLMWEASVVTLIVGWGNPQWFPERRNSGRLHLRKRRRIVGARGPVLDRGSRPAGNS